MTEYKKYIISCDPLWKKLVDVKLSKTELVKRVGLFKATVAKMGKNGSVTLNVITRICAELSCLVSDVMEIKLSEPVYQRNDSG